MAWELRLAEDIQRVGVVGAGSMGRGIAHVCALAGCSVQLFDSSENAVTSAIGFVHEDLMSAVARGKLSQTAANAALQRITAARTLEEMSGCNLVVEAIVEQLDATQQ